MKFIKQPKRIHLILAALLILNVAAYFTVSAITKNTEEEIAESSVIENSETFVNSGVKVLNWSYSLLRYFRQEG